MSHSITTDNPTPVIKKIKGMKRGEIGIIQDDAQYNGRFVQLVLLLVTSIIINGCAALQQATPEEEIDKLYRVGCNIEMYYRNNQREELEIRCGK